MTAKRRFRWNGRGQRWHPVYGQRISTGSFIGKCAACGTENQITFRSRLCWDCARTVGASLAAVGSRAHGLVAKARKEGLLPHLDGSIACADCGKPAAVYDHRDYSKPMNVDPVCRSCNRKRGMAIQGVEIHRLIRGTAA